MSRDELQSYIKEQNKIIRTAEEVLQSFYTRLSNTNDDDANIVECLNMIHDLWNRNPKP